MCYYNIGHCYKLLNNIESAVYYWLGRITILHRCEALYELIKHYRRRVSIRWRTIYTLWRTERNRLTSTDYLFQKDVYDYKLDYG
jgi:hypothetical protein